MKEIDASKSSNIKKITYDGEFIKEKEKTTWGNC